MLGSTLCARLGGEPAITAMTEALLHKLYADPEVYERLKNADWDVLKGGLVRYITHATNGSKEYIGRPPAKAHKGKGITGKDFEKLISQASVVMRELGVQQSVIEETVPVLQAMSKHIVEAEIAAED